MIGRILNNRYELIEKLGEGGMAEVYKAYCNVLHRNVAIKILKKQYLNDEEFIKKFDIESKSAAKLNHPNIVGIYDVGIEDNLRYIVMELLDGITLKDYIEKNPSGISLDKALDLSMQVASAIEHAHENSIIHRDIKPQNIIITKQGIAKVADFGIARSVDSSTIVNTKEMIGSVHYSSPEQLRGGFVDFRTDMYSFGVTMFELITGVPPFEGDSAINIAIKHLKETPPQISNIPESISKFVSICMSKTPSTRFNSFSEILTYLKLMKQDPLVKIDFTQNFNTSKLPDIKDISAAKPFDIKATVINSSLSEEKSEYEKPKSKKSSRNKVFLVIFLALVIAAITMGIMFVKLFSNMTQSPEVTMPNLIGMEKQQALKVIDELGLKSSISGTKYSGEFPIDSVVEQSEKAGTSLKKGFTVKLILSKGTNSVEVPNLVNKDIDEAKLLITNSNLKVGTITYQVSELPKDIVLSQSPTYGDKQQVDGLVNIVVSQGENDQLTIVPDVVGTTYSQAVTSLTDASIQVGNIIYVNSDTIAKDEVIAQSIQSGTSVAVDSLIEITVSLGPMQVEEPKLITKSYSLSTASFPAETETIKVELIQDGISEIVYQQEHQKSEGNVVVSVEALGEATVNFYYGGILVNSIQENFQ